MVFISLPEITHRGNLYYSSLPGALGPSLLQGGGLRALFCVVENRALIMASASQWPWGEVQIPQF